MNYACLCCDDLDWLVIVVVSTSLQIIENAIFLQQIPMLRNCQHSEKKQKNIDCKLQTILQIELIMIESDTTHTDTA